MKAEGAESVKITRPGLSRVVQRSRLFALLDRKLEKTVVWITSPAGSGKTTLVASYLDARRQPCLWYRCDEGDSDPATFFYYMGLAARKAAPRYRTPLPLLKPQYLAGISLFARRYFENLCSRLVSRAALHGSSSAAPSGKGGSKKEKPPAKTGVSHPPGKEEFTIVLDNYQDVPVDSPFHDMIAHGFDMIPEGIHVVVISRSGPPPAFARLQAGDRMDVLEYGDIRFTLGESEKLVWGRIPDLDRKRVAAMHESAEGWAAGIILMLERTKLEGERAESVPDGAYERVFDYFAGEIFNKTEKGIQDFLLKTAFLPVLAVPLAEKLTGVVDGRRILSALNRNNYFTEKLAGSGQDYQYHPLFRDFLLNRARAKFTPDEWTVAQREAALLLDQSGQIEDAARLYGDAGDWQGLARMVMDHAEDLLAQGRSKTVEEWIAAIPGGITDDQPWLLYWAGMCSFPFDMPRARRYLKRAFASFKTMDDTAGIYLSWAGIVDVYSYEMDEWRRLDDCIEIFEGLRRTHPSFPSKEIALIASSRMLISLTLRKTDQPQRVHRWLRRVDNLLQETPSIDIRMDIVFCTSLYNLWKGEYHKNAILLETAEADIRHRKPSPFSVIRIKLMRGIHFWVTAQYDSALHTLSEGLDIAGKSGVHVFDSLLWSFMAAAQMAPGRMEMAGESIRNQMTASPGTPKALDLYFYHFNSAWHAILAGNAYLAAENLETISANVAKMGNPYYRALWHIGMAQVAFMQERSREVGNHIRAAHRIARDMKSPVVEWYSLLIDAYFLLRQGREKEGLLSLRRGLSLGGKHGYVHLEFYQPSLMRFLYARALKEGIEPDYVKGLIRKLGLTPPSPEHDPGEWPYPVRIYSLGRFAVIRYDGVLEYAGKVQKKPLEMLKAVIAFGGVNVPADRLANALWPDADGDLAHKSFEMTLSRLRRLLGGENIVRYSAGQLSLDPNYCWVDSLALEHIIGLIRKSPPDDVAGLCERAVSLYEGPFLPADSGLRWTLSKREMLQIGLLRIIDTAGRHHEKEGQWERAAECYRKGLDTDDLAEAFYQRLIVCYRELGDRVEAVRTYNRCRRILKEKLEIEPSAETRAVYSSLLQAT
ncbi:MAG: AAA family ATPase [Syntrophaceae bacterium]|nr:AAA family ATPase [Syntrophaceae bacterium]